MPIYEYHCHSCGAEFETLVRNNATRVRCSQCDSDDLQKLISAHAVGSGAPDTACGTAPCSPAPACAAGACPACQ